MKFGPTPIEEAEGAVLAHAVRIDGLALKKGDTLTRERRLALAAAGATSVLAARLEHGDVGEDDAALKLAKRLAGAHLRCSAPFTGRVNLFAEIAGLAIIDADAIDRLNAVDEAITAATLPPHSAVADGDMVATVKIIPFAVPGSTLKAAIEALGSTGAISVKPFRPMRIGVVSTMLPGLKASVVAKTLRVLEARLKPTGARIVAQEIVPHEVQPLAKALARLIDGSRRARRLRGFRHHRPPRHHSSRDRGDWRAHRAVRHAGRSRQSLAPRRARRDPNHRRAGVRAVAEGERLRLGPAARAGRGADTRRGHPRDGRRRAPHGDRLAPAASRFR